MEITNLHFYQDPSILGLAFIIIVEIGILFKVRGAMKQSGDRDVFTINLLIILGIAMIFPLFTLANAIYETTQTYNVTLKSSSVVSVEGSVEQYAKTNGISQSGEFFEKDVPPITVKADSGPTLLLNTDAKTFKDYAQKHSEMHFGNCKYVNGGKSKLLCKTLPE